jgi:hypothetical protein
MIVAPGTVSVSITIQIVDDTGLPVTGLVAATFPATSYERVGEALAAISLSDLAALNSAYSSGGVKEVASGYYRLCVPNAAFATASRINIIGEATNKRIIAPFIDCQYVQSDVRQLLGTAWLTPAMAGTPDVNVKLINAVSAASVTAINANLGTTQPVNFTGTAGTALVKVDAIDWAGVVITAGSLPVGIIAGAAGGLFIAGSNAATTIAGLTIGTLIVTGATTFTGAVTASNASNNIQVILADGKAHGGTLGSSTATLALSHINVTNAGILPAIHLEAVGNDPTLEIVATNGNAMELNTSSGNYALNVVIGSGVSAINIEGGGGSGIQLFAGGGSGIAIISDAGPGLLINAHGNNNAMHLVAAGTEPTLLVTGATTFTGAFTATNAGNDVRLGATERGLIATALLDLADAIETGKTLRQIMRLMAASLFGKRSNSGTASETFFAAGNPATPRIVGNLDTVGDGTPTLIP